MKFLIFIAASLALLSTSTAKPVDGDDEMSPSSPSSSAPTFEAVDGCLRRAAATLPRNVDAEAPLEEGVRLAVRKSFLDANCPAPPRADTINMTVADADAEDGDERGDGEEMSMRTFTSTCKTCNTSSIDLQTNAGQTTVLGYISSCVLNADAGCCACMLKYVSTNYFSAIAHVIPTLVPTTTPTTTTVAAG